MPVDSLTSYIIDIQKKLDRLLQEASKANRRFVGVGGAAEHASLSCESIRRLLAAGKLTALRPVRGRILIDRRELDAVILASTTMPRSGRGRNK